MTTATLHLTDENRKGYDYDDRTYECAAWWQMHHANAADTEIPLDGIEAKPHQKVQISIPATTGEGYFAALWCGVRVSKEPYDRTKHAGQASTIRVTLTPWDLLTRDEIEIPEDAYDAVLAAAHEDALWKHAFCKKYLAQQEEDFGELSTAHHLRNLADAIQRRREIEGVIANRAKWTREDAQWRQEYRYLNHTREAAYAEQRGETREPVAPDPIGF